APGRPWRHRAPASPACLPDRPPPCIASWTTPYDRLRRLEQLLECGGGCRVPSGIDGQTDVVEFWHQRHRNLDRAHREYAFQCVADEYLVGAAGDHGHRLGEALQALRILFRAAEVEG